MEFYKCKYLNHENEEIIGFCLNQNCQKATQYCYEFQNQQNKQYKELSNKIKIIEINNESEDKIGYNIKESERLLKEEVALNNLNKYQEAIECYDKAISINPKFDLAWSSKGYALHQLQKYYDALQCYDQALSFNINPLRQQRKADSLFEIGKKSEAKQFYLAALEKGSNDKNYIQKQLSKL